jgi:hypothetical protein
VQRPVTKLQGSLQYSQQAPGIMALRPSLLTRGLSTAGASETGSPAEQRDDAKKNMLKAMRALPTQHYWNVYFDRYATELLHFCGYQRADLYKTAEGAAEVLRWNIYCHIGANRLADRVGPGLLAVQQQYPRRSDQDARVNIPVQTRLPARMGRPKKHKWRELDL